MAPAISKNPREQEEKRHQEHLDVLQMLSPDHAQRMDEGAKPRTKCCTFACRLGPFRLNFNPVVSFASILLIWGFVVAAIVKQESAHEVMEVAKQYITFTWTWLYIGTLDVWIVFVIVIYFSKYSSLKLGRDSDKPEFSDISYFTMLFAAGIGTGMFYFAVAEPIYHYTTANNRFQGKDSDNVKAQDAMNITFYHWGIHGWVAYVLVGLLLAFMGYRSELPMTMRTCFYPILGAKVFGRIGDMVDIVSVVCTMFGVCTSLGLGVIQLNAGFHRLFPSIAENINTQVILIWIITFIATLSVVSGVKMGIRRLSEICFVIGIMLMLIVFFSGRTFYILNLITQSIGYYFNFILRTGSHTDAFAQLNNSRDGDDNPLWMNSWTIFYWGWWVSWSPFVGMFIAKISKGRTIKDFIFYTMTIPGCYTFVWFSVFGGTGIYVEREAKRLELPCVRNDTVFEGLMVNGIRRLSCRKPEDMLFDMMESFGGISRFLSVLAIVAIVLYFVTSSDSGSLVIDCLTSNGEPHPPVLQRIFWSVTEGACATALLIAGQKDALKALQSAAVCSGLFYSLVLNFMTLSLWRSLRIAAGDISNDMVDFVSDLLDPLCEMPGWSRVGHFARILSAPWYDLAKIAKHVWPGFSWFAIVLCLVIPFYGCLTLLVASYWMPELQYIGWTLFVGFAVYSTGIRGSMRDKFNVVGNVIEDFFAMLLAYPLAVLQMTDQIDYLDRHPTYQKPEDELELMLGSPKKSVSVAVGTDSLPPVAGNAPIAVGEDAMANGPGNGDAERLLKIVMAELEFIDHRLKLNRFYVFDKPLPGLVPAYNIEQAYGYLVAVQAGCQEAADEILDSRGPFGRQPDRIGPYLEVKGITRSLAYLFMRKDLYFDLVIDQMRQETSPLRAAMQTYVVPPGAVPPEFVVCNGGKDRVWGVGMTKSRAKLARVEDWPGSNVYGAEILTPALRMLCGDKTIVPVYGVEGLKAGSVERGGALWGVHTKTVLLIADSFGKHIQYIDGGKTLRQGGAKGEYVWHMVKSEEAELGLYKAVVFHVGVNIAQLLLPKRNGYVAHPEYMWETTKMADAVVLVRNACPETTQILVSLPLYFEDTTGVIKAIQQFSVHLREQIDERTSKEVKYIHITEPLWRNDAGHRVAQYYDGEHGDQFHLNASGSEMLWKCWGQMVPIVRYTRMNVHNEGYAVNVRPGSKVPWNGPMSFGGPAPRSADEPGPSNRPDPGENAEEPEMVVVDTISSDESEPELSKTVPDTDEVENPVESEPEFTKDTPEPDWIIPLYTEYDTEAAEAERGAVADEPTGSGGETPKKKAKY